MIFVILDYDRFSLLQVQAGVARTGKWWGHQHVSSEAVEPDIMIFAKGIASGFPFAGEAPKETWPPLTTIQLAGFAIFSLIAPRSKAGHAGDVRLDYAAGQQMTGALPDELGSLLAGLATRDNMFDGLALGTMGGTYGAAPLACATANATLDVIQDENLLQNSTDRGRQLVEVWHWTVAVYDTERACPHQAELECTASVAGRTVSKSPCFA